MRNEVCVVISSLVVLINCLLLPVASLAVEAAAEKLTKEQRAVITQELSDRIMSPFCPGRTLSACPSDQARKLRQEIDSWLQQGYTRVAVENRLSMIYGDQVFGVPKRSGFGLLGWWAPAIFVVVTVLGVVLALRRLRSIEPPQVTETEMESMRQEIEAKLGS